MSDYLDILAISAKETVSNGYYEVSTKLTAPSISLKKAIIESKENAVITEIKVASPSRGAIKSNIDPAQVALAMKNGGAIGISILTEPKHFNGSLSYLEEARKAVKLPILMKDIIINPKQLEAASKTGANAVLLIETLFKRKYSEYNIEEMIKQAHSRHLEVLLETHTEDEFQHGIETDADLIGINNRDLRTLKVDFKITEKILKKIESNNKIIVSESGLMTPADLLFLKGIGVQAFLVGSSIMMADNIEKKVKEFVTAC